MILCVNTYRITAQNKDSLTISPKQVENVYIGLKQGEIYKQKLIDCIVVANKLDSIIVSSDNRLQKSLSDLQEINDNLIESNIKLTAAEVKINDLEKKKTKWYRHPLSYFCLGIMGGMWLAK